MALTAKQEQFAQLIVSTSANQSDAYRQAFDVSPACLPETIHQEASRLAANPNVSARIQELRIAIQAESVTAQAWTLDRMILQAQKHMALALSGGPKSVSAANSALELIGRLTGLLSDRAREPAQVPITRVVVVLDAGPQAPEQQRFTEAEAYKVLPQAVAETERVDEPPAGITNIDMEVTK